MGNGVHCQIHIIGYPQVCIVHVWCLHTGDVLLPCAQGTEESCAVSTAFFMALVEGAGRWGILGPIWEVAVKGLLPKLFGKAIVGRIIGMDLLQKLAKPWDLPCLQCKSNGTANDAEEFWHGYQGGASPSLTCQPDSASDVTPDYLFDKRFQVWATGEDNDHFSSGILDDLHYLLDILLIGVLRNKLTEINADVPFFCLLPELFNPWPAIVIISCNSAHPVPSEILNDVCHCSCLMLIIGDCAEEGFELVFVAQESAG